MRFLLPTALTRLPRPPLVISRGSGTPLGRLGFVPTKFFAILVLLWPSFCDFLRIRWRPKRIRFLKKFVLTKFWKLPPPLWWASWNRTHSNFPWENDRNVVRTCHPYIIGPKLGFLAWIGLTAHKAVFIFSRKFFLGKQHTYVLNFLVRNCYAPQILLTRMNF